MEGAHMTTKEIFSQRLAQARRKANMKQSDLASKVGVTQTAMSSYERGRTLPTIDIVKKLAEELKVSLDWLCGNDEFQKAASGTVDAKSWLRYMFELVNGPKYINVIEPDIYGDTREMAVASIYLAHTDDDRYSLQMRGAKMCEFFDKCAQIEKLRNDMTPDIYEITFNGILEKYANLFEPDYTIIDDNDDLPF
jgi:transcriptional regulator with XRE-family HTH domain